MVSLKVGDRVTWGTKAEVYRAVYVDEEGVALKGEARGDVIGMSMELLREGDVEVVKEPRYRPFKPSEFYMIREHWFRRKDNEHRIVKASLFTSALFRIDSTLYTPENLLNEWEIVTWDGNGNVVAEPCGVQE